MSESDNSKISLFRRATRILSEKGPSFAIRRAVWHFHFERFQKQKKIRTLQPGQQPSVIQFLGADFELHPTKRGLSEELIMFGSHEPLATGAYLQTLSPSDHVIDIGSNIGYWLLLASRKVGEAGRILGFEPVPSVYEILQRNIKRSGQNNIEVYPWAIGSQAGSAQFYQSEIPNWGSLIQDSRLCPTGSYAVPVKRLDDILRDFPMFHPTALRMDVEGAELMVLEGARDLLRRFKPTLFIEFHPFLLGWKAIRDRLTSLLDLGYSSGVLIERTWDHPWIDKWMREHRCWSGSIDTLIRKIESPKNPLVESTLTLILKGVNS